MAAGLLPYVGGTYIRKVAFEQGLPGHKASSPWRLKDNGPYHLLALTCTEDFFPPGPFCFFKLRL